jgi:hypothetical protein
MNRPRRVSAALTFWLRASEAPRDAACKACGATAGVRPVPYRVLVARVGLARGVVPICRRCAGRSRQVQLALRAAGADGGYVPDPPAQAEER